MFLLTELDDIKAKDSSKLEDEQLNKLLCFKLD